MAAPMRTEQRACTDAMWARDTDVDSAPKSINFLQETSALMCRRGIVWLTTATPTFAV